MKQTILFPLPGNENLASALSEALAIELGDAIIRAFPDGESYVRIVSDVKGKTVFLISTLDHPNAKLLPLIFMAQTIKALGAKKIGLVCPYLPYMRQDKRFRSGEAITSILFAPLLSSGIDCMITIDPHLHRIKSLSDIYAIPHILTLHATPIISEWILHNIKSPILIGPDEESRQWVAEVAGLAHCPFVIGEKKRLGDADVQLALPNIKNTECTPVLIDDVISTGASMLEAIRQLHTQGFKKPICIGVHALLNAETINQLMCAGAANIVTCNTIPHPTNQINITSMIAKGIAELC